MAPTAQITIYFLNHLCDEQRDILVAGTDTSFLNHLCDEQL
ncbi:hypothetical protein [Acinetobacter seifertii]